MELRPLLESSSNPRTRELLRAGLGERPPARAVEVTAAALGLTVSLSASTVGATALGGAAVSLATPPAIGALVIVKWLAVGAVCGTIVAGGSTYVRYEATRDGSSERRSVAAFSQPDTPNGRTPLAPGTREPVTAPDRGSSSPDGVRGTARPGAAFEETQRSPAPISPSPIPRATPASPSAAAEASARTSQLSRELALIDRARASISTGAAEQALVELSAYDATRVTGTLDREARILRIDALLLLGKRREARELARSYLEGFPRDAHAARLLELANGE